MRLSCCVDGGRRGDIPETHRRELGRKSGWVIVWRNIGATLPLMGLLLCSGTAFATVLNSSIGFNHDWGTINTAADYVPAANGSFNSSDPGTHLEWHLPGAMHENSEDFKHQPAPIPSPNGALGEYWDTEVLAFAADHGDSGSYYFLAILSTADTLYNYGSSSKIAIGDLAINPRVPSSGAYVADYGIKLAGTNKGQGLADAPFGWGIDEGKNGILAELRNPSKFAVISGSDSDRDAGGYSPDDGHYAWASNFTYTAAAIDPTEATVKWAQVLGSGDWQYTGAGTGADDDGPGDYGLDTYAIEITIPKWRLYGLDRIESVSLASTCLNDGLLLSGLGGGPPPPPVPELPPTLLAVMLPAVGLLVRRLKSR